MGNLFYCVHNNDVLLKGVSMQESVVITDGKITLPTQVIERLGLSNGDRIFLYEDGGRYIMSNATRDPLDVVREAFIGEAERVGWKTEEDVVEYIKSLRNEMDCSKCETCLPRTFLQ